MKAICLICGQEFIGGSGRKKYCSDECGKEAGETKTVFKEMICANCGIEFTGRKRKFCSKECCLLAHGHNPYYKPSPTCLMCGKPLTEGQKKYCSSTCCQMAYSRRNGMKPMKEYRNAQRAEIIKKRTRICETCGKEFIMLKMSGKGSRGEVNEGRFCSYKCKGVWQHSQRKIFPSCNVNFVTCDICGKLFLSRRGHTRCSEGCDRIISLKWGRTYYHKNADQTCAQKREEYEPIPKIELLCKQCGNTFMGNQGNSYCSKVCRQSAKQGRKEKRRAEKAGVFYEPVNPLKVFKRDGWKCQLCGKKLKLKHRGTYRDDAPELDHIIPWAQGGEHSYRNTQCACRKCNSEKGAQEFGQLRLFG